MTNIKSRAALAKAVTNDKKGTVSQRDARAIVAGAVKDIAEAKDPAAAFEAGKKTVDAAAHLVGRDKKTRAILASYEAKATNALSLRLGELSGTGALPAAAKAAFEQTLRDYETIEPGASVSVSQVKGNDAEGYTFRYRAGSLEGDAFALRQGTDWLFAPAKLTAADLENVTAAARAYFDENWAPELRDMGESASAIRRAREAIRPERGFFPGESDPHNYVSDFPIVLEMRNKTGSDHGFYVGYDPRSGETSVYTFN